MTAEDPTMVGAATVFVVTDIAKSTEDYRDVKSRIQSPASIPSKRKRLQCDDPSLGRSRVSVRHAADRDDFGAQLLDGGTVAHRGLPDQRECVRLGQIVRAHDL